MKIVIVDDHDITIEGIKSILKKNKKLVVAGSEYNVNDAFELINTIKPEIVISDIFFSQNSPDGIELCRKVKQLFPEIKFICLTQATEASVLVPLIEYEADGIILKSDLNDILVYAIDKVIEGEKFFSSGIIKIIANYNKHKAREEKLLTQRELEILQCASDGLSNTEIAEKLFMSKRTVEQHRSNIILKLQAQNMPNAVSIAFRKGLLS